MNTPIPDANTLDVEEMFDFFQSFVNGTPLRNGQYAHNAWCNGSRAVPRGTPGYSCSCRTARENELIDEMMQIVDLLEYARDFIPGSTTHSEIITAIDAVLKKYINRSSRWRPSSL